MPFRTPGPTSHRQLLSDEARMCFAAATGCLLIGLAGGVINRIAQLHLPLTALVVVGVFYGLMGLGRLWKLARTKSTDRPDQTPAH